MATIELPDELVERIDRHCESDVTREEFLDEVLSHYETEGRFLREGYSGEP
ncbi:hypothetical protein ACFQMA_16590 [Halosimplex aquaticum]|uniref:Ribbon-helix-helix protein, copG family n=1 Tax=Halosimplex aquaticum TaxID=3026162 RepID=A0ABD5YAU4_9EURY|nr:hypothetical protein [Halosimplex aquaticum]